MHLMQNKGHLIEPPLVAPRRPCKHPVARLAEHRITTSNHHFTAQTDSNITSNQRHHHASNATPITTSTKNSPAFVCISVETDSTNDRHGYSSSSTLKGLSRRCLSAFAARCCKKKYKTARPGEIIQSDPHATSYQCDGMANKTAAIATASSKWRR